MWVNAIEQTPSLILLNLIKSLIQSDFFSSKYFIRNIINDVVSNFILLHRQLSYLYRKKKSATLKYSNVEIWMIWFLKLTPTTKKN